jgi:hypothetical protein
LPADAASSFVSASFRSSAGQFVGGVIRCPAYRFQAEGGLFVALTLLGDLNIELDIGRHPGVTSRSVRR